MTEWADRPVIGATPGPQVLAPSATRPARVRPVLVIALSLITLSATVFVAAIASESPAQAAPAVTTVTVSGKPYTPHAAPGTADDYHCTLVDPHLTHNAFVVSSQFRPGSGEVHHAVLALVPPSVAAAARQANTGNNGWTCFGTPVVPGGSLENLLSTPFLSVWAPGHGADTLPKGTGISLPAGSLVTMQVHYNLPATSR